MTTLPLVITEGTDPRVLRCPGHVWRLEDRTPPGMSLVHSLARGDEYICDICQVCRAIRCDRVEWGDGPRCLEARHHDVAHRFPDGSQTDVGA